MKILLVGYYGKGNFGDDILFKVTFELTHTNFRDAEIYVLCDQYKDDYLHKLTSESVNIVAPGHIGNYDLIIHGGGGTFFDFKKNSTLDSLLNFCIKLVGCRLYSLLEKMARSIFRVKRIHSIRRIGLGIGIGTYTKSSKKLRKNIPILSDFDNLVVRDHTSVENLAQIGIKNNIILGSDLAFLSKFWAPKDTVINDEAGEKLTIGLVLRDWGDEGNSSYLNEIEKILPLLEKHCNIEFFSFDNREDTYVCKIFAHYKINIWDPITITLEDYSLKLANTNVLITARAHGAICGALLGVPSIIINLEPKLETIHKMLPNATKLISTNNIQKINMREDIEYLSKISKNIIKRDVTINKGLIQDAINLVF